jgi:DNA invertase Pin-like site-specific DNA recombinase
MSKKLVVYKRVSSEGQEENTSLADQERKCINYVENMDWEVVACLQDVSTGATMCRKGLFVALRKLVCMNCPPLWPPKSVVDKVRFAQFPEPNIEDLTAPCGCDNPVGADGIVVWKLDRLSRDMRDMVMLAHDVIAKQGKVLIEAGGMGMLDSESATGRLITGMFALFAEFDRESLKEKLHAGWKAKKSDGGYAGGGAPYGWYAMNRELVPHPYEQSVVLYIHKLHNQGFTTRVIADCLNEQKIRTKRGGDDKKATAWNHTQVARVLKGPTSQVMIAAAVDEIRKISAEMEEWRMQQGLPPAFFNEKEFAPLVKRIGRVQRQTRRMEQVQMKESEYVEVES